MNIKKHINPSNYNLIIGVFFILVAIFLMVFKKPFDAVMYMFFIAFASITLKYDIKKNVKLKTFLISALPFILLLVFFQIYGYAIWGEILEYEKSFKFGMNFNNIFDKIPFNDAAFARVYQPEWLNVIFRFIYNNGFVVPAVIPIYRALIAKDIKKTLQYSLSSHIVQIIFISPMYATIWLQEVWFVRGEPDMLLRGLTNSEAAGWTLNCFPSMHTSIAFAMFLLVLREKDKLFKYFWGTYCLLVIYSTMYLKIHWTIDVIGGIVFAFFIVKLVDYIMVLNEKNLVPNLLKVKERILEFISKPQLNDETIDSNDN